MYPHVTINQNADIYVVHITTKHGEVIEHTVESWADAINLLKPNQATGGVLYFDEFWAAYPTKIGKKTTKEAWKRHNCDKKAASIMDGLQRYLKSKNVVEGFIVNPVRFLTQERWNDDAVDENNLKVAAPDKEPLHVQLLKATKARNTCPIGDEPVVITMAEWTFIPKGYCGIEDGLMHKVTGDVYPVSRFRPMD